MPQYEDSSVGYLVDRSSLARMLRLFGLFYFVKFTLDWPSDQYGGWGRNDRGAANAHQSITYSSNIIWRSSCTFSVFICKWFVESVFGCRRKAWYNLRSNQHAGIIALYCRMSKDLHLLNKNILDRSNPNRYQVDLQIMLSLRKIQFLHANSSKLPGMPACPCIQFRIDCNS